MNLLGFVTDRSRQTLQLRPRVVLAVVQEQSAPGGAAFLQPTQQLRLVGVGAVVADPADIGPDLIFLAVDPDRLRPRRDDVTQRPGRLIADEQDRALGPVDVRFEVMFDPAGGAHPRRGDDDRAPADLVDPFALFDRFDQPEIRVPEDR